MNGRWQHFGALRLGWMAEIGRHIRFRRALRRPVSWQRPSAASEEAHAALPEILQGGDWALCSARIDGRLWLVRERIWWGWPDLPRYAFFAFAPDGALWAAGDFTQWPAAWGPPPD